MSAALLPYAELHCLSNFTFLRGASQPAELVKRAGQLEYAALAITDECSVAGVVRAHVAAKEHGVKLIIGAEFQLEDGLRLVLLARSRVGYGELCELITRGRRRAIKGRYQLRREDLVGNLGDCLALWLPGSQLDVEQGQFLAACFPARAWIAVELLARSGEKARLETLRDLGRQVQLPLVACGDVHMHARGRRALQDALTAIRLGVTVAQAGQALYPNGERFLRRREMLSRIYPADLLDETMRIAARCDFSLDSLRYEYPEEIVPSGETPAGYLRRLTDAGLTGRYPDGVPEKVRQMADKELSLIAELRYEPFFLTVHDVVCYARAQGILCQGRGSAANSVLCYALRITEVDPARMEMLFERFISKERNEPPDIDVDFEHERREEVIQYLYTKYGRERAALAATVICYRRRSAFRDMGKALGLDLTQLDRISKNMAWWDNRHSQVERLREAGFDPHAPVIRQLIVLVDLLAGFPRHLSQHVGGFVISRGPLSQLVPVENATMEDRTVIQWDKDDLDALGLLKVDVLALGMLTAIRKALDLVNLRRATPLTLSEIPADDADVFDTICKADTIGVFQIESRAQMSMLPRLRPRNYYDLVIEVAIVRPGPIQGGMVHPYLRRRQQLEPVSYPSEDVKKVLERTLGVPIFQEQVMQLAVVAAGFTPGEADQLRRSMAAWHRKGGFAHFEEKLITGMRQRGYSEEFSQQIFRQIQGFGEYGFPESHSASFALLVYISAWLKHHEQAAFTCALLNSQPMGFYAPSQLVQDAQRHGVEVRPVDVLKSDWDCTLEADQEPSRAPVLRLGLRMVSGLSQAAAQRLIARREISSSVDFSSMEELALAAQLSRRDLNALVAADSFVSMAGHRRAATWLAAGIENRPPLLRSAPIAEALPDLFAPSEGQEIVADYASVGLTLRRHPLALLRPRLRRLHMLTAEELGHATNGQQVRAAGLVTCRQRPGTASGVVFITIEDETGQINVVVWGRLADKQRRPLIGASLLGVHGVLERQGEVAHLIAARLVDYSALLGQLSVHSRDFH